MTRHRVPCVARFVDGTATIKRPDLDCPIWHHISNGRLFIPADPHANLFDIGLCYRSYLWCRHDIASVETRGIPLRDFRRQHDLPIDFATHKRRAALGRAENRDVAIVSENRFRRRRRPLSVVATGAVGFLPPASIAAPIPSDRRR